MNYFDAHTHTQFAVYGDEKDAVITRARDAGVGMNVVGTQYDTSRDAVALAEKHSDVWATIGLHPIHTSRSHHDVQELGEEGNAFTSRGEVFDSVKYRDLAQSPKVVAIGECGLDYFRVDPDTRQVQSDAFIAQIELANTLGKPLMLHVRASSGTMDAYEDVLDLVRAHAKVTGDVHFFAGSWDIAKQFLDLGFTLSFTGVITFTHDYDEVIRNTPLDRILSETDAPYVTPAPFRGKRNEPSYIPYIVRAIAGIRGEDEDVVREALMVNTRKIFDI